jgi:hypothetical protein
VCGTSSAASVATTFCHCSGSACSGSDARRQPAEGRAALPLLARSGSAARAPRGPQGAPAAPLPACGARAPARAAGPARTGRGAGDGIAAHPRGVAGQAVGPQAAAEGLGVALCARGTHYTCLLLSPTALYPY